ncbi:MAG: Crp/Fnr family transcriptional regulator [Steroidobacteraceae bacterium]
MSNPCNQCLARRGTICSALDDAAVAQLFAVANVERHRAGTWLVNPGDRADDVWMLRDGHAHVSRITRDGKRQILAFLFPGDFFAFTQEERYVYGAYADADLLLCRLSRARFEAFVDATPELDRRIRAQLARSLDSAQELIFTLGRKTALERVASFIWYLQYRQRKLGRSGPRWAIPMSRTDIADFLGLTSESVSRAITQLRRDGLIDLPVAGEVEIRDMPRLRELGVVIAEPVARD